MKKLILIFMILGLFSSKPGLFAQAPSDSLITTPKKVYPVKMDNEVLSRAQLNKVFAENPEAKKAYTAAKTNQDISMLFGFTGGFMFGWPLGQALGGGDPQWYMAAIGAGVILLTIPFTSAAKKKTLKAVELYNEGLVSSKEKDPISFKFQSSANGIGLVLKF